MIIEYRVMDLNDYNETEQFLFQLNQAESKNISFQGSNQFTGIELWNKEGYAKEYPVSFDCANIKDGCICYTVTNGSCRTGLRFLHVR